MTTFPACSKLTVILVADHRLHLAEAPVRPVGMAHQHSGLEEFVHAPPPPAGGPAMSAPDLSALVSARLCHDLISPMGAIGNGLELMQLAGTPGAAELGARQRQPRQRARQAPLLPHRLRPGRPAGAALARRGGADHRRDVHRPLHRRLGTAGDATCRGRSRGSPTSRSSASSAACRWAGTSGSPSRKGRIRLAVEGAAPRRRRSSGRTLPRARRCPSSSRTASSSRCCAGRSTDTGQPSTMRARRERGGDRHHLPIVPALAEVPT